MELGLTPAWQDFSDFLRGQIKLLGKTGSDVLR